MKTSVENILGDILLFAKKCAKTFVAPIRRSYPGLVSKEVERDNEMINAEMYLILTVTIFYSLTIAIISKSGDGIGGMANVYLSGIKSYSLLERVIYSIPIWIFFFVSAKLLSLVLKKEERNTFTRWAAYCTGTYLLLFVALRVTLYFIVLGIFEYFKRNSYWSSNELFNKINTFQYIQRNLSIIFPTLIFLVSLYKTRLAKSSWQE